MSGLNKVCIIGNLGADPESRQLPSGSTVSNFRVAVSRKYKNSEGEAQEETEWFPVVAFGKLAETVQQFLSKGRKVYVEGRLKTNSWDDKDTGDKKYRTEVVAQDVQFLDSVKGGAGAGSPSDSMPF
ncbi:MAG: single-stranded DNA-binding protein [Rhabdochlamydiaceae bacterium]